jgi:hypothetical protein
MYGMPLSALSERFRLVPPAGVTASAFGKIGISTPTDAESGAVISTACGSSFKGGSGICYSNSSDLFD